MSRLLTRPEAEQFKELLVDYRLRDDGMEQFLNSNFGIIAGPAGAGKDTLRNALVQKFPERYVPILSTTTRPPRIGEEDGVTYHFQEIETVRSGIENREYFQAELVHNQQVSCLHIDEINKLTTGQTGLSILITETENKLHAIKQNIKTVFLIPPDLTTLMSRIQSERLLNDDEINRRLSAARTEIEYALQTDHYYCLVTETVEQVASIADTFFQSQDINREENQRAREIMQQILDTLNDW